jgi:hypothetical protein
MNFLKAANNDLQLFSIDQILEIYNTVFIIYFEVVWVVYICLSYLLSCRDQLVCTLYDARNEVSLLVLYSLPFSRKWPIKFRPSFMAFASLQIGPHLEDCGLLVAKYLSTTF